MTKTILALLCLVCLGVEGKQLIVLSSPKVTGYYSNVYQHIINFHIRYAKAIQGKDDVLVLTNAATHATYAAELPAEILIKNAEQADIWMRDFTTINPNSPVQFRYAPAAQGGSQSESDFVQGTFNTFATDTLKLSFPKSTYILDGGNVVDNHDNRAVVTDRFLTDNNLDKATATTELKKLLKVSEVAIIPSEAASVDPLGHADGMVMWASRDVIFVNEYTGTFRQSVLDELAAAFPSVKVVEVPSYPDAAVFDPKYASAIGINLNSVMTEDYIYMPVFPSFNTTNDNIVKAAVERETTKTVVTVDASLVGKLGGSVRCLTWQVGGATATQVKAALVPGSTTSAPRTTAPVTSAPRTTAPLTTAPRPTAPLTTAPRTTAPLTTVPVTTVPRTTAPSTTAPLTTSPLSPTKAPSTLSPTQAPGSVSTPSPTSSTPAPTAVQSRSPTEAPKTESPSTPAPTAAPTTRTTAPLTTAPLTTVPVTTAPTTRTTAPLTTAPVTTAPSTRTAAPTTPTAVPSAPLTPQPRVSTPTPTLRTKTPDSNLAAGGQGSSDSDDGLSTLAVVMIIVAAALSVVAFIAGVVYFITQRAKASTPGFAPGKMTETQMEGYSAYPVPGRV